MKKLILLIFLGLICQIGFCQFAVYDGAVHATLMTMRVDNKIEEEKKTWLQRLQHTETLQRWHENLEGLRKGLDVAKDTKREIENLYALQRQLSNAMEAVQNIEGITLSDMNFFTKFFLDIDINAANYIPRTPYTSKYIADINKANGSTQSARALFNGTNSLNRYARNMSDLSNEYSRKPSVSAMVTENKSINLGLEEARGSLLMEQVIYYNQKIDKNLADANRLRGMANDPAVKISEAERFRLNQEANLLMEEVVNLRLQATDLLIEINTFKGRPETKNFYDQIVRAEFDKSLSNAAYKRLRK